MAQRTRPDMSYMATIADLVLTLLKKILTVSAVLAPKTSERFRVIRDKVKQEEYFAKYGKNRMVDVE